MHTDFTRNVSQNFVSIFQFDFKSRIGKSVNNDTIELDHILFCH